MVYAIILAGGSGSRMGSDTPKQLMKLMGKEIIYYPLATFCKDPLVDEVILVSRKEDIPYYRTEMIDKYGFDKVTRICPGGEMRYYSVYSGLSAIEPDEDELENIVLIHDGARPFVTHEMIRTSVETVRSGYAACTVGMPVKDTIKVASEISGTVMGTETPDRSTLYQIQTPQTFTYSLLARAYEKLMREDNRKITEDTMVVETYGGTISRIIPGSYENIKITTPEDLLIAQIFAEKFFSK